MSLFTDLRDVFTAYAQRIKALDTEASNIKADLGALDNSLESEVGTFRWIKGHYMNVATRDPAEEAVNAIMTYAAVDCAEGDTFIVNTTGASGGRAWAFLDSGGHVVSMADANVTVSNLGLTVPANAVKLIINSKGDGVSHGVCYKTGSSDFTWVTGKYIRLDGNAPVAEYANNIMTYTMVNCLAGDVFRINTEGAAGGRAWGFLDSSNNIISAADANVTVVDLELTAPTGAVKLVINSKGDGTSHGACCKVGNSLISQLETLKRRADDSKAPNTAENVSVEYHYDDATNTFYYLTRIFQTKTDGTKQYPFTRFPTSGETYTPQTLRAIEGWDIIINAGWYKLQIENGIVLACSHDDRPTHWALTIDDEGTLGYLESWEDNDGPTIVASGVVSAQSDFYPLVVDYEIIDFPTNEYSSQPAQRQILGQYGNGDYCIITSEGRGFCGSTGWTVFEAADFCKSLGLKFAFSLDGGGSTQTVVGKKRLNQIYEGTDGRLVHGFIVFNGTDHFYIPDP